MNFELFSEDYHNLLIPQSELLTQEMVLEVDELLKDGLLEIPYLIVVGEYVRVIEREAIFAIRNLESLLQGETGALIFTGFEKLVQEELEDNGFTYIEHLDEAMDHVYLLQLDRDEND
jgi:hypothetical protein